MPVAVVRAVALLGLLTATVLAAPPVSFAASTAGLTTAAVTPAGVTNASATPAAGGTRGRCPNPPQATAPPLPHGALAMYCVPRAWNGQLLVWDHGYVDFTQPLGFYNLTFPNGHGGTVYLPDLVEALGYAFGTTSYRTNGLAVLQGVQDTEELVDGFSTATGAPTPTRTLVVGASEGGLIATLLAERSPQRFAGALAACGPIGSFQRQLEYIGDMRVVFDYFFPGVLPGSPISIPISVIDNWNTVYEPAIQQAVTAHPAAASQLYSVVGASVNPDPSLLYTSAVDVLWYNVFGTNDASSKLGGNPYSNVNRVYHGSDNDVLLNQGVQRFPAAPLALVHVKPYETSGKMTIPLVTMHTTGDDVIPFWHEELYAARVASTGSTAMVTQIPVNAYGHCNFTLDQLLGGFAVLVKKVG
jgi:pimeloyl-ACP methyl ester carboxylesterase